MSTNAQSLPEWGMVDLRHALTAAGVALWSWNVDSDHLTIDERGFALWGIEPRPTIAFDELSTKIHPADRDRVHAAFAATRAMVGSYEIDFRIMVGRDVRWISTRGRGEDVGIVGRIMFGIFLDVSDRKQSEEANELLAGEMSHRVKNLLAIASSLTSITSRSASSAHEMASELTGRLAALGRAHDLVRPIAGADGAGALVGDLISILLAPYDDSGAFKGRIRVSVPRMAVGERSATNLALLVHELATNSVKYGALSVESGTLDVSSLSDGKDVRVVWAERGGPPVVEHRDAPGFGTKLLERMSAQLGGSCARDWSPEGLIVTLRVNKDRLIV